MDYQFLCDNSEVQGSISCPQLIANFLNASIILFAFIIWFEFMGEGVGGLVFVVLFVLYFLDSVFCVSCWPQTQCAAKGDLEVLPPPDLGLQVCSATPAQCSVLFSILTNGKDLLYCTVSHEFSSKFYREFRMFLKARNVQQNTYMPSL